MNERLQWMPSISLRIVLAERNHQTYSEFQWERKGHKIPQTGATNELKAVLKRCVIFRNLIIPFKLVGRVLKEIRK